MNASGPRSPPAGRGGAARSRDSAPGGATPPAEADQPRGPRRAGHARRAGTASPGGTAPSRISGSHPGGQARVLRGTATSRPSGIGSNSPLPAKPAEFLHSLATRAETDTGSAQTKMHICAIDAASQLPVVSSPSGDAPVGAFRRGDRRGKRATRSPVRLTFRGEIPVPKMPQELPPGALAAGQLSRQGLSLVASARAPAAAGRHLVQTPWRVTMTSTRGSWGTSCLKKGGQSLPFLGSSATAAAQASPSPCLRPPSPARVPHCSWIRCAMEQLLAAFQEVQEVLARGLAAAEQGRHPETSSLAGCRGNVACGSAGARPPSLAGIPAHSLPIIGPRDCPGMSCRPYS